jgi:hypothetical protein
MNNDLIVERLAHSHHQALIRAAGDYRQHEPARATSDARPILKTLLLALSFALPLALLLVQLASRSV